mgnify:CR=1 FL=1
MDTKKWQSIGTVLGETNIDHFYFSLKNYKAKKAQLESLMSDWELVEEEVEKFS